MDEINRPTPGLLGVNRRTLIRSAAWSLPVIALAVAAPGASASDGDPEQLFSLYWQPNSYSGPNPQATLIIEASEQMADYRPTQINLGNNTMPPFTFIPLYTDPLWTMSYSEDLPDQQFLGNPQAGASAAFTFAFGRDYGALTSGSISANVTDEFRNVVGTAFPFLITGA